MALSRYTFLGNIKEGKIIASYSSMSKIYNAVETGRVECAIVVLENNQRVDQIAGSVYGDSSYWWVITAASGVGWGLQVPPGTLLRIPKNLNQIIEILS